MSEANNEVPPSGAEVKTNQSGREWYAQQLKDPRWQRRRLEVMQAAGFKCEFCGDESSTLHVHHLWYNGAPWDAPSEALECLCEGHHKERECGGLPVYFTTARAGTIRIFVEALRAAQARGESVDVLMKDFAGSLS